MKDKNNNVKNCDRCGHSLCYCDCKKDKNELETKTFKIKNLDCANCGSKIENKLNQLPGIESCTLSFPTMQLSLTAKNPGNMLPEIIDISRTVEPDIDYLIVDNNITKKTFNIIGLDCANCAKKVEQAIADMDGIENANLSYETSLLKVETSLKNKELIPKLKQTIDNVEDGITLTEKESKRENKEEKKFNFDLFSIILGTIIFASSWMIEGLIPPSFEFILQLFAYLILGGEIVLKAVKNILKGNWFDENFLMSVATIGAFIIGDYHEGVGVMLFYRIGEYCEDLAVEKSRKQIIDAIDLRPETVNLVIDDRIENIPANEAEIGDILEIRPGERIPLDGVILEGNSKIDTSPITGEPVPVIVKIGDEVTSGTINEDGLIRIKVVKPLADSMVTKILESVENAAATKPKMDRFITKFSKIYTPIVVFLALGVAIIPSIITGNWHHWVYTAISFLVISCPCALVLSIPLAYFCGIGAASKLGILFKGGLTIEAIKNVKAVILDKTGTITKGNFVVQKINPINCSADQLITLAAECEQSSTHPIATSIMKYAKEHNIKVNKIKDIKEISGKGIEATIDGSKILCGNSKFLKENHVDLRNYHTSNYTEVLLAKDNQYIGSIEIGDEIKENAKGSINKLINAELVPVMLTGDKKENALFIGNQVNIKEVLAEQLPQDKLTNMKKLREKYNSVMFVGDGINDAPVLAGADVGAAMGSGSDAAIEAADVVFMTSDLNAVNQAIKIGKLTAKIAWQNVVIALAVKAVILLMGLFGFANMWLAVFADTGVAMLCILNSIRILFSVKK